MKRITIILCLISFSVGITQGKEKIKMVSSGNAFNVLHNDQFNEFISLVSIESIHFTRGDTLTHLTFSHSDTIKYTLSINEYMDIQDGYAHIHGRKIEMEHHVSRQLIYGLYLKAFRAKAKRDFGVQGIGFHDKALKYFSKDLKVVNIKSYRLHPYETHDNMLLVHVEESGDTTPIYLHFPDILSENIVVLNEDNVLEVKDKGDNTRAWLTFEGNHLTRIALDVKTGTERRSKKFSIALSSENSITVPAEVLEHKEKSTSSNTFSIIIIAAFVLIIIRTILRKGGSKKNSRSNGSGSFFGGSSCSSCGSSCSSCSSCGG